LAWIDEASEAGIFLLFFNQAIGPEKSALDIGFPQLRGGGICAEGSQKAVPAQETVQIDAGPA
jgi:hypothetical protein